MPNEVIEDPLDLLRLGDAEDFSGGKLALLHQYISLPAAEGDEVLHERVARVRGDAMRSVPAIDKRNSGRESIRSPCQPKLSCPAGYKLDRRKREGVAPYRVVGAAVLTAAAHHPDARPHRGIQVEEKALRFGYLSAEIPWLCRPEALGTFEGS
jgi:hypothetical protein